MSEPIDLDGCLAQGANACSLLAAMLVLHPDLTERAIARDMDMISTAGGLAVAAGIAAATQAALRCNDDLEYRATVIASAQEMASRISAELGEEGTCG